MVDSGRADRTLEIAAQFAAMILGHSFTTHTQQWIWVLKNVPSVVTPKPANGGQGKTGQREEAGDSVVLSCRLLWWQVYFRTPTPGTTFEYMTMMEKTIEHGGDSSAISH